ncbi:Xyloglucan-specific galacturonosyltransferase 1 [Bienertia sinuspersici]
MAVSVSKKKPKKPAKKQEDEERGCLDSCLCRFLNRIPVAFLLIVLVFIWSSSTTIISGSIVHVCVTSRKLNNLYCLSAGAQPTNYGIPLNSMNNSKLSVAEKSADLTHHKTPVLLPNNTTLEENTKISVSEKKTTERVVKVAQKPVVLSPVIPSTSPSVSRNNVNVNLPVSSKSQTNQVSDGSTKEVSIPSPMTGSIFTKVVIRKGIDKARAEELANARKEVEGQIAILRSYISKSKPSYCEGRGVYVYDLPPKFNKDLLAKCDEMMSWLDFCKYFTNNAMGEAIPELGKGWYNTYQYSLEPIFHNLILKHPCRVYNQEEAKLFYVPFYGGLDILRWHFNKAPVEMKDSLSKEMVEWLEHQRMWKRNFGLDHVFVLGKVSWDFRRWENVTWGSRFLEFDEIQNPMKLLIERQPWHQNDVGVPHPTYFHPRSDEEIIAWQEKIRQVNRKHLISFAGALRKDSGSIRSILIEQCTSAPFDCNFFDCADQKCEDSAPVVTLFMESEFCLQPTGDTPTRKSLFDSLIAGCIPVVFDPFTAYYQYPWHLPHDYSRYSVFIDKEEVKESGMNAIKKLTDIPLEERQKMRKYIIDELMPRLVYAHPDAKLEKFEDAFMISVNNLLERAVNRLP